MQLLPFDLFPIHCKFMPSKTQWAFISNCWVMTVTRKNCAARTSITSRQTGDQRRQLERWIQVQITWPLDVQQLKILLHAHALWNTRRTQLLLRYNTTFLRSHVLNFGRVRSRNAQFWWKWLFFCALESWLWLWMRSSECGICVLMNRYYMCDFHISFPSS